MSDSDTCSYCTARVEGNECVVCGQPRGAKVSDYDPGLIRISHGGKEQDYRLPLWIGRDERVKSSRAGVADGIPSGIVIDDPDVGLCHAIIRHGSQGREVVDLMTGRTTLIPLRQKPRTLSGTMTFRKDDAIEIGKMRFVNVSSQPPAYDGDRPFLLVSYCREDREIVCNVIRELQNVRYRIFYDYNIKPCSGSWRDQLLKRLKNRSCMGVVYFVTDASVASPNVRWELIQGAHLAIEDEHPQIVYVAPGGIAKRGVWEGVLLDGNDAGLTALESGPDRDALKMLLEGWRSSPWVQGNISEIGNSIRTIESLPTSRLAYSK